MAKPIVVLGFLGSTLDQSRGSRRWGSWRPSISVCMQEDLPIQRFEMIYSRRFKGLLEAVVSDIKDVSPHTEVVGHQIEFRDPWDFEEVFSKLHEFARSYPFDLEQEDYLIHITTGTHVAQICLFLLAESKYLPGRLLQTGVNNEAELDRHRAKGVIRIIDLDLSKYDPIAARFVQEAQESQDLLKAGIATRNAAFNSLIQQIETVATRSSDPLLLLGPTGAGKTELARRIYRLKHGKRQVLGRFVEVNCATLKGDSVMSTLFGHVKGSFTGAVNSRAGLLKEADGGLIFLDEIGELGLDEQAMLLRAIEEKSFLPLGSDREVRSDFQLIAGTNRDLAARVKEGLFREDLLARIHLWTFRLPKLSDRREDIEPNLEFELSKFSHRTGKKVRLTQEARSRLLRFATSREAIWPGNFRDLNALVSRLGTLADSGRISEELVDAEIAHLKSSWTQGQAESHLLRILGPRAAELDLFDRAQLEAVLEVCSRSKSLSEAGRTLFSVSRTKRTSQNDADRIKKYLARFGLDWENVV